MTESEARGIGRLIVLVAFLIFRIAMSYQLGQQFGVWVGVFVFIVSNDLSRIALAVEKTEDK